MPEQQYQAAYTFPMSELSMPTGNEYGYHTSATIPEDSVIKAVRPLDIVRLELTWSNSSYGVRFFQPALLEVLSPAQDYHSLVQTMHEFHDIYAGYRDDRLPLLSDADNLRLSMLAKGLCVDGQEEMGRRLVHAFAVADPELRKKLKKRYPKWFDRWIAEWASSDAISYALTRAVQTLAYAWPYNIHTSEPVGRENIEIKYDNDFDSTLDLLRKSLARFEYEKENAPREMPEWWHKMIDGATAPLVEELARLELIRAGHEVRQKLKKVSRKKG